MTRTRLIAAFAASLSAAALAAYLPVSAAATPAQIPGWEVFCNNDNNPPHVLADDPILHPGEPGMSHWHLFFGNQQTDANSTPATLRAAGSTTACELSDDKAAYWTPQLYINGVADVPTRLHSYYRWGNVADFAHIRPIPYAARLIAGNAKATAPQSTSVIGWSCGKQGESLASAPKDCRNTGYGVNGAPEEVLHVFFPNCFTTSKLSSDYTAYVYSKNQACPAGTYAIPRLSFDVAYHAAAPSSYRVAGMDANGNHILTSTNTEHADFMNGWKTSTMATLTRDCVDAGVQCGPLKDGQPLPAAPHALAAPTAVASGVPGWPAIPAACAASPARIWWGQNQPNQPLYRENSPGQFCLRSLDTDHNWQTLLYFTTQSHLIVVDCLKGASSCYYVWGSGNILSTRGEILLNYACDLVIYTVAGGYTHTWDYHVSQPAGSRACSATASNASAYIQAHCMPDYYRTIWGRPESRYSIGNC